MKISKIFLLKLSNGEKKDIKFGTPTTKKEREEMFKLRNKIYTENGYIAQGHYQNGLDIDKYDKDNKCVYFIAKVDDRIIGSLRIIQDKYLPTEKYCFDFEEPEEMKRIPRSKRIELGRLVVEKYANGLFFKKNFIMLGLLDEVFRYCAAKKILGGYAFIKNKLKIKLEKIKFPIILIEPFKQKYDQELLRQYFNDPNDVVWPIYYLSVDAEMYLKYVLNMLFIKNGEQYKEKNFFHITKNIVKNFFV